MQRLLSQAIDEYKKVNKIKGIEFSERLKHVVDEYNNRRRDEAYANEVLDDVAEQLAKLLEELKNEKIEINTLIQNEKVSIQNLKEKSQKLNKKINDIKKESESIRPAINILKKFVMESLEMLMEMKLEIAEA